MLRILRSPQAEADVIAIWAYIAEDNLPAADEVIERFELLFHKLADQPHMGKVVEELAINLRVFSSGSYLIFYRVRNTAVEIIRVVHGARELTSEFFSRLM